jgi:glycosyltransferase involved in cell wall biosynthesis
MRFLLISTNFAPKVGGVEVVVDNLAQRLASSGHQVELVTALRCAQQARREERNGFRVHRLYLAVIHRSWKISSKLLFPQRALATLVQLNRVARASRSDVIVLFFVDDAALYALLLKYVRRIPLVVSLRGADLEEFPIVSKSSALLLQAALQKADALFTPSHYLLDCARTRYDLPARLVTCVIPNGVSPQAADEGQLSYAAGYALVISRLVWKKGVDTVLEAYVLLRHAVEPPDLLIIGDGPERSRLEAMVAAFDLQDSVRFLGEVAPAQVGSYLAGCSMLILASRQEPFGNVVLEGMAAGRPVIATRVGGVPELLQHEQNGLLVAKDDPAALAAAVMRLLTDGDLAERLGREGAARSQNYSFSQQAQQLLSLCNRVIERRSGNRPNLKRR